MSSPGYLYLVEKETAEGKWFKVGIAARIGRVLDHSGWSMSIRTFEVDTVLENPRHIEQIILSHFNESGVNKYVCSVCGAKKPPIGRNGEDGLTEVRHSKCYSGLKTFFESQWNSAKRLHRSLAWQVDFDPLLLQPDGMKVAGQPWRQPPRMDASEYMNNTCNVICIKSQPTKEVLDYLDYEWSKGTIDLRKALWERYGESVCKMDGSPTPKAKGSGASGDRSNVESKLTRMAKIEDVEIVLVSVRKPGMLYAYHHEY